METFLRSKHAFIKYALFGIGFVLLAAGSLVSRADYMLDAQFIESARSGKVQEAENLLKRGASVNATEDDGYTALMLAAKYGHKEIVQLLLDKGADFKAKNRFHRTAWDEAEGAGNTEIAQIIGDFAAKAQQAKH